MQYDSNRIDGVILSRFKAIWPYLFDSRYFVVTDHKTLERRNFHIRSDIERDLEMYKYIFQLLTIFLFSIRSPFSM